MTFKNIQNNIIYYAMFTVVLWCLFCISSSVQFDESYSFKAFCLILFAFTLARPLWGVGFFLVLMPFFGGSKPQDLHTVRFFTLLSTVVLAGGLYFVQKRVWGGRKALFNFSHPLVFFLFVYWLITALSLVTVQPNEIVLSIFKFNSVLTRQFLNLSEASPVYPWLTFFALTVSMFFGLLLINLAQIHRGMFQLLGFFLIGVLLTVVLGLLDYYDVINLNIIRPWYFVEALGGGYRFLHLTSVFGNPGWYAQYLVLGAPSLLTILALNWQKKWKITTLVCLMVITEFCIILIYQRGGWISYPLTLIIIWFCVYVLDSDSNSFSFHIKAIRSSLIKITLTLPITIAISLSLVYFTARVQPDSRQQLSSFEARAGSITNANDRMKYWEPTFLIARLHPLFGPGVESFSSQYDKLYIAPGHLYVQTPQYNVAPDYGSAHNLYFQTLAGKGFLGLLSLLGVMLAVLVLVWRGIFSAHAARFNLSHSQRLLLMMTLAYTSALAIYGNVGEIFYSPIGYVLFVLFFAASIGGVPPTYHLSRRFRSIVLALIGIAFVAHLYLEFGARFGI